MRDFAAGQSSPLANDEPNTVIERKIPTQTVTWETKLNLPTEDFVQDAQIEH